MPPSRCTRAAILWAVTAACTLPAAAQQIADGVVCSSAKLRPGARGTVQVHAHGDCDRPDDDVQVLAVDLSRAKVEPVVGGAGPGYPTLALAQLASVRRPAAPFDAVAAINGGFFYPYRTPARSYSLVVDLHGRAHPPATMRVDQQCRSARRSQITLVPAAGDQLPVIQPHLAAPGVAGAHVLGGGGRILPHVDSASPSAPCPCAPAGPCDRSSAPDPDWNAQRARTAVGFRSGEMPPRLYLATAREPAGLTLRQLAEVFRVMTGADHAIALDGGGSSQMWIHDTASGRSHDFGGSRLIVSALVVYADPSAAPAPPHPPPPPAGPLACDPRRPPGVRDRRAWCDYGRCVEQARGRGLVGDRQVQQAEDAAWRAARRGPFTHGYGGGACSVY